MLVRTPVGLHLGPQFSLDAHDETPPDSTGRQADNREQPFLSARTMKKGSEWLPSIGTQNDRRALNWMMSCRFQGQCLPTVKQNTVRR